MVVLPVSENTSCLRSRMCVHFEVARAEGQGEVLTVNIATQGICALVTFMWVDMLVRGPKSCFTSLHQSHDAIAISLAIFFPLFLPSLSLSTHPLSFFACLGCHSTEGGFENLFTARVFRPFGNPGSLASRIWCHCPLRRHCVWGRGVYL